VCSKRDHGFEGKKKTQRKEDEFFEICSERKKIATKNRKPHATRYFEIFLEKKRNNKMEKMQQRGVATFEEFQGSRLKNMVAQENLKQFLEI